MCIMYIIDHSLFSKYFLIFWGHLKKLNVFKAVISLLYIKKFMYADIDMPIKCKYEIFVINKDIIYNIQV